MIDDFSRQNLRKAKPSMPAGVTITPQERTEQEFGPEPLPGFTEPPKPRKPKRRSPWAWFKDLRVWQRILVLVLILALIGGAFFGYTKLTAAEPEPPQQARVVQEAPPEPTTAPNTLTGREVELAVNERPVTGVMIENSTAARPQSGLYDAGVVFEAIAEGGITRFLALYQDTEPASIGPVRSVRPYYIQWALGFDAAIAHVGGSGEALQNIRDWGVKDLDQGANSRFFERVTSRYAPHNVYTSLAKLQELEAQKGFGAAKFTGFARKAEQAVAEPNARTIDMNISSSLYRTSYTYDPATNSYMRNLAGAPHMDAGVDKQINPKVVIGMVTSFGIHPDRVHSAYGTIGSGQAYIFQDGTVTVGTWTKNDRTSQITFTDAAGKTIALNSGQTWITAIGDANRITYGP